MMFMVTSWGRKAFLLKDKRTAYLAKEIENVLSGIIGGGGGETEMV